MDPMSDDEIPRDTCYTCNVSPSAAEARGREQGRREAAARIWAEVEAETVRLGVTDPKRASGLINNWLSGLREAARILDGTSMFQPESDESQL